LNTIVVACSVVVAVVVALVAVVDTVLPLAGRLVPLCQISWAAHRCVYVILTNT